MTFVYNRERVQQLEKKNKEQESTISKYATKELSLRKTVDQLQAKVSDLNSKVNPGYLEKLESKLEYSRQRNRDITISLQASNRKFC